MQRVLAPVFILSIFLGILFTSVSHAEVALRVGAFSIQPLIFTDANGNTDGFNVDLLNRIAEQNDWQLTYIPGSWNDGLEGTKNGRLDLITTVMYSKERDRYLEYSKEPFFTVWGEAYIRAGSDIGSVIDLNNRTVAVMKGDENGSNFKKLAADFHVECSYLEFTSFKEVFNAVSTGKAAAGIAPNFYGIMHAAESGLVNSPIIFNPSPVYFAAPEGKHREILEAIDTTLRRWKKDRSSYYYAMLDTWLNSGGKQQVVPSWIWYALMTTGCLILFLYLWSRLLNRQVKTKTRALVDSEQKYRTLLANQNDAMLLHPVAKDGFANFIEVNGQAEKLYGYSATEFMQLSAIDISPPEVLQQLIDSGQIDHLKTSGQNVFEAVHIKKSGEQFPVEVSSTIVNLQGQDYFLSFIRDISDRKLAEDELKHKEEKFRTLFEHVTDYAMVLKPVDQDLLIADLNEAACSHHGYLRNELVGQSIGILDPIPIDTESPRWDRLHAGELLSFEVTHRRKNGTVFPAEVFIKAIEIEGEQLFFSVERDITARKQAEEHQQLLETQLRRKYKMEAVGLMAGGVAHDFNNILSIILTNLELIYRKLSKDSQLLDKVEHAREAASRGSELVKQILTYSRQGEQTVQPILLAEVTDEALKLLRSAVPASIEILKQIDPDCKSSVIHGDPIQLEEVVINLCQNAIHAMDEKGLLTVNLCKQAFTPETLPFPTENPNKDYFILRVSDTGHGIPEERIDKIFDPFFTTKVAGEGTGMGLAICQGIINKHNGQITVSSELERGTTFTIYLPVTGEQQNPVVNQPPEIDKSEISRGTEHILLVDDEESLVDSVAEALKNYGYQVTAFTCSTEALERFRQDPANFDMLITDQTMPQMTGMELSSELLDIRPDLPIILCTGYSASTDEEKAKLAGIETFLLKPLAVPKLLGAIRETFNAVKSVDP